MKSKTKKKLQEIANNFWFFRLYKRIRNRHLCPKCLRNPKDKENPNNWCFHCYYQSLTKTTYRARKQKLKGGKKKMCNPHIQKAVIEDEQAKATEENKQYEANCMKCKKEVSVRQPEIIDMKGKGSSTRKAVKGKCSICGANVFRILKKQ